VLVLTGAGGASFCAGADLKTIDTFAPRLDGLGLALADGLAVEARNAAATFADAAAGAARFAGGEGRGGAGAGA
jgi:enoyl-CoA hydratase/carnithine racemase